MAATGMSFREVPQNKTFPLRCKEISLTTGGVAGSLQDQKQPESAGGYTYRESGCLTSPCCNRYIYWRTHEDVLELTEESLDVDLSGANLRVRFQGAPVLGNVGVHELHGNVVIMVATVSSVHRLIFQHPNKINKVTQGLSTTSVGITSTVSIFSDASVASTRHNTNTHVLSMPTGAPYRMHTATSWLGTDGEALVVLATSVGSLVLVKFPPHGIQGVVTQHELKQSSVMQRIWSGLIPAAIRGGSAADNTATSMVVHPLGMDVVVFSISLDHKLRLWSTKTHECLMVADMLEYMPDNVDPAKLTIGSRGHRLCKASGSTLQSFQLAVYLSFTDRSQFCVFKPVITDGQYHLSHVTTVFGMNDDLIDMCLSGPHLWTVWTSSGGDTFVRASTVVPEMPYVDDWLPVFMESANRVQLEVPSHKDARQTYTDYIFNHDRFSTYAILRALKTYRRSLEAVSSLDLTIPRETLIAEVTNAVEHEIQAVATDCELAEDEYRQLQLQQWTRLYSCCTQYQQVDLKPLSIFADPNTGLVGVVQKNSSSFVRPAHLLEHLYFTAMGGCRLENAEIALQEDTATCQDVLKLCDCLKLINSCLTPAMEMACNQDLYHTQSASVISQQVVGALLTEASLGEASVTQMLQEVEVNLQTIRDIAGAAECLANLLDLSQGLPENLGMPKDMMDVGRQLSCSHIFTSSLAVDTLSKIMSQMADTFLDMARDLLFLLTFILNVGEQVNVSLTVSERIRSELLPRVSRVLPQYFVLSWCALTKVTPVTSAVKDMNARQLEALDFTESTAVALADKHVMSGRTLLAQYVHGCGGVQIRAHLSTYALLEDDPCTLWSGALVPMSITLAQLLWPVSANFGFAEFLMVSSQYTQLQEYVRLTRDWCDWNEASRRFMLAFAYVNTGEPYKAMDQFLEAVHGVSKDSFLKSLMLRGEESTDPCHAEISFLLKVIQLFELFNLPHLVVSLASTATVMAAENDPNLPTVWSKVFKHQLELGHDDEAYEAMVSNPDPSRRKDCLRQLLVVLCERGQLQTLIEFPYIDLHDEVVSILESRARSVDLTTQNYYDLLYSFHVFRGNYRKASSVMYEYGLRLGREVIGLKGLQRQAKCYLAALNALRLVDPKYAWLVKPGTSSTRKLSESEEMEGQSPKHSWDGEEVDEPSERTLEVLELEDVEREYLLVHARLRLLQKDPDRSRMSGPTSSAADTVALLVNAGLFDCATNICRMFDMPLTPIFEGMAARCVRLARASADFQQGDNDFTAEAWTWLEDNDLGGIGSNADVSSSDQAWKLLQTYLQKYEDRTTRYHKAVALKLLSEGFNLPNWFIASYKRLNAAALLRLYLDFDHLEDCVHLAVEYIDAVLGCGTEYFGLKACLSFSSPSVWIPYTCIDQLLIALRDVDTDATYRQLYNLLSRKLEHYHTTVESVSRDVVTAAQQQMKIAQLTPPHRTVTMMES